MNFLFDHVGIIQFGVGALSEDEIFEKVSEAGGEDFEIVEDKVEVLTAFIHLGSVREALEAQGIEILKSEPEYRAKDPMAIEDEAKLERFIEAIEEVEDVDEVFVGALPY